MEQELRDRWAMVAGPGAAAESALAGLLARYREPHRHYHGLAHVIRVLRDVDELLAAVPVDDGDAVRLAAWFHDAVYDPRSSGNEAASARLADEVLSSLGLSAARRAAVARLVLATATHEPRSDDEAVLVDADLAVLAADPATYSAYAKGVRREYVFLDDASWRQGRAEVVRSFLGRARIFITDVRRDREPRARANLTAELAGLGPSGP
jgi:predicted metal-dependent HD superfamily phosphohydrolase